MRSFGGSRPSFTRPKGKGLAWVLASEALGDLGAALGFSALALEVARTGEAFWIGLFSLLHPRPLAPLKPLAGQGQPGAGPPPFAPPPCPPLASLPLPTRVSPPPGALRLPSHGLHRPGGRRLGCPPGAPQAGAPGGKHRQALHRVEPGKPPDRARPESRADRQKLKAFLPPSLADLKQALLPALQLLESRLPDHWRFWIDYWFRNSLRNGCRPGGAGGNRGFRNPVGWLRPRCTTSAPHRRLCTRRTGDRPPSSRR